MTGCLVLLRDVTDVRRLDRLLLSKDAAIREVHHRVKNNLQTISALLRLQARRLPPGGGRVALFEAERRVRSIAIVHEILSRDPGDQVPFEEIVTSLIRMAEDSVVQSRPLTFEVVGGLGEVPADVATPLAVVLAELLQNAVEHAFPDPDSEAEDGGRDPARDVRRHAGSGSAGRPHPGPPGQRLDNLTLEVVDDGCRPPRRLRHRRLREPRPVHRPRPGPQPARRHDHHAQPGRHRPGEPGTVVTIELPATEACGSGSRTSGQPGGAGEFRGTVSVGGRVQEARRRAASQTLRSLRRSSSEVPPQTPDS